MLIKKKNFIKKCRRIFFDILFKNLLMRYSFYRISMNKLYRLFIYNAFNGPNENYLNEHKNNKYLNIIKVRSGSDIYNKDSIPNFDFNLQNNFKGFFKVNIKKMSSVNGSRLNSKGDPLCNTALQLIKDENTKMEDLFLHNYYKNFTPKNLSEVFLIQKKNKLDKISPYNRFYPWHTPYPPPEHQDFFFGPKNYYEKEIKFRTYRLKNIYKLINEYGYIPDKDDCIDGYILTKESDYRFIITAGHHRSSVLSAMNILDKYSDEVTVKFDQERIKNKYFVINKKDIKKWPAVKNGFLSEEDAILLFDSYFKDKIYI